MRKGGGGWGGGGGEGSMCKEALLLRTVTTSNSLSMIKLKSSFCAALSFGSGWIIFGTSVQLLLGPLDYARAAG